MEITPAKIRAKDRIEVRGRIDRAWANGKRSPQRETGAAVLCYSPPMDNRKLMKLGISGTVIAAICCATPVLVIAFGAVGLGALVGYLDLVLLPLFAVFIAITCYALYRKQQLGGEAGADE